jgi:hypothetical protein
MAVRPTIFDRDVLAVDIASLLQAQFECGHKWLPLGARVAAEDADHGQRCLLRARCEWPRGHRAEQRYEFAPPLVEHGAFFLRWAP